MDKVLRMDDLGKAVRHVRQSKNMTLEDVAHQMNVEHSIEYTTASLSRFEAGKIGIKAPKMRGLMAVLGVSLEDLEGIKLGLDQLEQAHGNGSAKFANDATPTMVGVAEPRPAPYIDLPSKQFKVDQLPIYKGEHVAALAQDQAVPQPVDYLPGVISQGESQFAWRVSDDSMTASPGAEMSFPMGSFAHMDPAIAYRAGDCALVHLGGHDAAFVQLSYVGGRWMMCPLNTRYPARDMPPAAKVVAVAVGVYASFKRVA